MTEVMSYDVLIVGAGPAGLAAAIKLKQLSSSISVCIIEKGSEVGAHILSGAVIEPRALNELLPDWQQQASPLKVPVTEDRFLFLSKDKAWAVPNFMLPATMKNHHNYIASLGLVCRWLAEQAIALGVEIYPGFAANKIVFGDEGRVMGVITGDMGVDKNGAPKANFTPGVALHAKYTLFAEGCRGYLAEQLMKQFGLRQNCDPQTYGLGIKELWQVEAAEHRPGLVQHTAGWPLNNSVYGGSFIYHLDQQKVAVGFVIGLDYRNPYLDPFLEMQRFKTHPAIAPLFAGAKRLEYGARALNEGGLQSIPKLIFPGGALIGCAAGFLNVAKIKGSHNAMKSGMLAAEAIVQALAKNSEGKVLLETYPTLLEQSWVYDELKSARNFRAYFRHGLWSGTVLGGLDLKLFKGKLPWTLHHAAKDRNRLKLAKNAKPIAYPKADGKLTFDKMSSVYLASTQYDENQPCHLKLRSIGKELTVNYAQYASPEQRYCPAGVYEINMVDNKPNLHINAANCVHCKTCDIKDPADTIRWTVPEGGSGPNYSEM